MRPGDERAGPAPGPPAFTGVSDAVPTPPAPPLSDEAGKLPEVPDSVREAALNAPDHWLGVVDPEWPDDRPPPHWAVVGEWRADEQGVVREYRANPEYRPSARVLGWPEPTDPVDAAAQRAATGYGAPEQALAALAEAEVSVVRGTDGRPLTAAGTDGAPVVLAFTSPTHQFMSPALVHDTLPAGELAYHLRGSGAVLMVNAAAAAPLVVPVDSLPVPTAVPEAAGAGARTAEDGDDPGERAVDHAAGPALRGHTTFSDAADGRGECNSDSNSAGQAAWPYTTGRIP
ncbi:type VII secretion system-associated protein [Streptomyces sp. SID625]|nr:type VII secretion system-associated protein [Streptomyces sp. SID625]